MIGTAYSRISHRRMSASVLELRYPDGVRNLLSRHRKCVPGDGHRPESCSARKQLLEIVEQRGWQWIQSRNRR